MITLCIGVVFLMIRFYINKDKLVHYGMEQTESVTENRMSNSERYNSEAVSAIINECAEKYYHPFTLATAELEDKLYGVWQAKEFVGYVPSSKYQWEGMLGNVIVFLENALIYGGTSYFNPVYAYYETCAEDMEKDDFLDIAGTDGRYEGQDAIVMLAVCVEENGERIISMPYRIIIIRRQPAC